MKKNLEASSIFWNDFSNQIKNNNRFYIEEKFLNAFDMILQNEDNIIMLEQDTKLYRARINMDDNKDKSVPYDTKLMGPPPKNKQSPGRLNPIGISYLYLARDDKTCIYEVKPYIGDYVTVGIFQTVKQKTKLLNLSDDNIFFGLLPELTLRISLDYSRPINPQNELDYLSTQFFTEYVKRKGFDGIQYSSSVRKTGKNITLFKTSDYAKCVSTSSVEIREIEYRFSE